MTRFKLRSGSCQLVLAREFEFVQFIRRPRHSFTMPSSMAARPPHHFTEKLLEPTHVICPHGMIERSALRSLLTRRFPWLSRVPSVLISGNGRVCVCTCVCARSGMGKPVQFVMSGSRPWIGLHVRAREKTGNPIDHGFRQCRAWIKDGS